MKLRTAAICAAGSLSAALKVRSKPFSLENAFFMFSVFALRHPDSDPVCAKPTLIALPRCLLRLALAAVLGAALLPPLEELLQPVVTIAKAPSRATPASNFFFTPDLLDLDRPCEPAPWDRAPSGRDVSLHISRKGRMLSVTFR